MSMRRRFCTSAYEFLITVSEGVVHDVHKVVIQSSFGVIRLVLERFAENSRFLNSSPRFSIYMDPIGNVGDEKKKKQWKTF